MAESIKCSSPSDNDIFDVLLYDELLYSMKEGPFFLIFSALLSGRMNIGSSVTAIGSFLFVSGSMNIGSSLTN